MNPRTRQALPQLKWWLSLAGSVALPALVDQGLRRWGGHFVPWIYYSDYRDWLSLAWVVSAVLVVWVLQQATRAWQLRFLFGSVLVVIWLLAAALPRPTCEERLVLGTGGRVVPTDAPRADSDCGR